jgi:hypothetical protein
MANAECAWWGVCSQAARHAMTAIDPCSGCATTVGALARVVADATADPNASSVPIGTSKMFRD